MKNIIKNLKKTWQYIKEDKSKIFWIIVIEAIMMAISILIPILSAKIIVNLTNSEFKQLIYIALAVFATEVLRNLFRNLGDKLMQMVYRESYNRIQNALGKEVLKLDNQTLDENGSGVFIQRLTNDSSSLSDIFNIIIDCFTSIITNIGIFIAIFIINKWAFVFFVISSIIECVLATIRSKKANEKEIILKKQNEKISSFTGELIRGARDIKMLNSEDSFLVELKDKVELGNQYRYDYANVRRIFNFFISSFSDLVELLLIVLLVKLIINNEITIPLALVIHNYSGRVNNFRNSINQLIESVAKFKVSSERVFAIIDGKGFTKEKFGKQKLNNIKGDFKFKDVHFGYNEKEILKGLSFNIKSGETVAFVGKSGTGKSTIFSLLCKMYDVDDDHIFIDEVDINKLDKDSIRGNITIIRQDPYIFNLSIRDNLRLVKQDLTEEEMIDACENACLTEFIESLPDKYDTVVGEGGVNLSGGQKQRLAIARALVQKTKIILFDEATSALDNETQANITKAINNMKGEYTILIIAHRLSTIKNSNRILYLEDGKIKAKGTHAKLMKECSGYKKLYETEIENS